MNNNIYSNRDKSLFTAFEGFDLDIAGKPSDPMLILDNHKLLHSLIQGPLIHFLDKTKINGDYEIIKTANISGLYIEEDWLEDYLDDYGYTDVYRLRYTNSPLYVVGFDYKIKENKDSYVGKYPVFGKFKFRYYPSKEYAESIIEEFDTYPLEIQLG